MGNGGRMGGRGVKVGGVASIHLNYVIDDIKILNLCDNSKEHAYTLYNFTPASSLNFEGSLRCYSSIPLCKCF